MTTEEEFVARVSDVNTRVEAMPPFAYYSEVEGISYGPSQVFAEGVDHEVELAKRTGRALQAMYGERLNEGDQIAPEDLKAAMDSVAYVQVTEFAWAAAIQILRIYWKFGQRLP